MTVETLGRYPDVEFNYPTAATKCSDFAFNSLPSPKVYLVKSGILLKIYSG
jgi:hypothetical protein